MEPRFKENPVLWEIAPFEIPNYSIEEFHEKGVNIVAENNVFDNGSQTSKGVSYDINRVSSRNARKSELGPYKNSYLREIISSHNMGKASGTKSELVATILSYHENKSK